MSKKKQEPITYDALIKQLEDYVKLGVADWENATGLRVFRIDVEHHRPIGFNQKETTTVNVILE